MTEEVYKMLHSQVVYEDNHIIVLNKLPGQIVQGDKTGDVCLTDLLKDYLKIKYNKPGNVFCGLVHRLDRPVSGLVMFAKTDKALTRLTKMVKDRKVNKTYLAIVKNAPKTPSATLENYIKKNEKQNKSYIVKEGTKDSKIAVLDYSVVGYSSGGYTLLEVHLHTGRHHQIRTQLSNIGSPIRGDLKYGYPRSNSDGSISLHSYKLEFEHPIKKEIITLEAKPITKDALWSAFF